MKSILYSLKIITFLLYHVCYTVETQHMDSMPNICRTYARSCEDEPQTRLHTEWKCNRNFKHEELIKMGDFIRNE